MFLTREEEEMLGGEYGPAVAKSIELLVAVGKIFEAERLIPIESAHVSGVSYKNLGDAGLEFLEEQADLGAKVRVKTTLNPAGMDLDRWMDLGVPEDFAVKQMRVIKAFKNIGIEATCTCTPYLIGHVPRFGSQIAWAESSAIAYSNSVIGARTNRESGPTTIASAITGRTPLCGYRLDENRAPQKIVIVNAKLKTPFEYSALGYLVGEKVGSAVPYFKGIFHPDLESLKALGAALATSGGIALYHIEGITPETLKFDDEKLKGLDKIGVDEKDLREASIRLSSEVKDPIICLGCPHCSLKELKHYAKILKDKRLRRRLIAFTSRGVYDQAEKEGCIKDIEHAGGRVFRDTCMVVAPLKEMGWREISTNSFKAAHYASSMGIATYLSAAEHVLREASA
ncbi:aconitase X catalytic domain-containing protein [Candidatus Bathyarchaeota archaeon]|nr:aconitase X catalytic domain-containing protein [Candidatus Bathyarchaeota archaeon]MBS7630231.1 aconitase X catalytic domain-containing protein [Candidatus Bathyarchaeota archaeon]